MGNLFGKKKKEANPKHKDDQVTDKDRAILDLKNARDRLKKYRKKLDKDSANLTEQAKQLIIKKQKNRALLVLKLRRFKEEEADKVEGELLGVLEMIENVEWEHTNMQVLKALKAGNASLNKLHEEMSIDDVAELLDETNEAIEMENQINNILAGQFVVDDAELEKELAAIMGEDEKASVTANTSAQNTTTKEAPVLPSAPNVPVLPVAPTSHIEVAGSSTGTSTNNAQPEGGPVLA